MALNYSSYSSLMIWLKEGGRMVYELYTVPKAPALLIPLLHAGAFSFRRFTGRKTCPGYNLSILIKYQISNYLNIPIWHVYIT